MHLLYCDETNLDPKSSEFFIYGGLIISQSHAVALHQSMEHLRKEFKFGVDSPLKFNPKPSHLDHAQFIELKRSVIEAAVNCECKFIVSLICHQVAKDIQKARLFEINRVLFHYDLWLEQAKECGLVLIDRFSDSQLDSHLKEKFLEGIYGLPYSRVKRLERILGIHYSAIGQSHFPSVVDIVIGSLRYAVNSSLTLTNVVTARTLLQQLSPLFIRWNQNKIPEISLFFSPKSVRSSKIRNRYKVLHSCFVENDIVPMQSISD